MQEIQRELYFMLNFNKQTIMRRIIHLSGFITVFFISTSIMFKTSHWPGANILVLISPFLIIVTSAILLYNSLQHWKSNSSMHNTRVVTGFISALFIGDGLIFKLYHYAGGTFQIAIGVCLLNLIYLPILFYGLYKQTTDNSSKTPVNS